MNLTALDDQLAAATAEQGARLRRGAELGLKSGETDHPRLTEAILRLQQQVLVGRMRPCGHLLPDAPQPAFVALWDLSRICCLACIGRLPEPDQIEAHSCDLCRRYLRGQITPSVVQFGPVLLLVGVCLTCLNEMGAGT